MKRSLKLLAATAILFAMGAPASAASPVITSIVQVREGLPYFDEACPSGFEVLFSATIERRSISSFENGSLVREIRHVMFEGTLSNSITGTSLPYGGHFTRIFDAADDSVTITGLFRSTRVAGGGLIALDAGRSVVDDASGDLLFSAGNHAYDAGLCDLLS